MATYYATDDGENSTVTESTTGQIVFQGSYDRAVTQAEELNRQNNGMYSADTIVKPRAVDVNTTQPAGETYPEQNQSQDDSSENLSQPKNVNVTGDAQESQSKFNSPSYRQHNPLSEFSSSTYKISLYAIAPEAYNNYYKTGRWDQKDLYLIVQSGGITDTLDSQRASGFELDFFIDNLEIETLTNAKENNVPANSVNFKFQVLEPYGLTFPSKLVANQVKIQQLTSIKRPVKQQIEALQGQFLLMIRFYGYDENGAIVTRDKYNDGSYGHTDNQAAFERAFPIIITKFNFRVDNKVTVYDIQAKLISEQVSAGIKRGTLPVQMEVNAATVAEAIGAVENWETTTGFLDKLNALQQQKVKDKKQMLADEYAVIFEENSNLAESTLVDKNANKSKVPMMKVSSKDGANVRTASTPAAQTVRRKRAMTFASGMPIIQALDQILSQSSFISDTLAFKDNEEATTVQDTDKTYEQQSNPKTLSWYIIVPQVDIIDYDDLRNDYAYRVTYVIKRYEVPYIRSMSHKYVPKYYGPHKRYNYWYTGQNSEVLAYEQQYNLLYFNTGALSSDSATTNKKDSAPNSAMPATNADPTGLMSGAFEAANSIKTFLYSPGDQLKAVIKILGDPDFLMPATSGTVSQILQKWYGPDFTVNPSSGQVYIELVFNQVEDYGPDGTLKPNNNIEFWKYPPELKTFIKGMVYMLVKVTSKFSKGTFTQELKTILPNFGDMTVTGQSSTESSSAPTVSSGGRTSTNSAASKKLPEQERLAMIYDAQVALGQTALSKKSTGANNADDDSGSSSGSTVANEGREE